MLFTRFFLFVSREDAVKKLIFVIVFLSFSVFEVDHVSA